MPIITLTNGNQHQYNYPVSPIQIAKDICLPALESCIAAKINGKLIDIVDIICNDVTLEFITIQDNMGLNIIRNSCAHLLGYAIKQLWPTAKMVTSSVINTGFYYDIDLNFNLTKCDLSILTQQMLLLANKDYNIIKKIVSWQQANEIFLSREETYKILILNENIINTKPVTLYYHEEYIDLCKGPHVPNISFCKYFKLYKITKSYWNEINTNKTLQRIYGIAWINNLSKKSSNYLNKKNKKVQQNDHRNFASQLDLYHIQENAPGMIFWHENGWIIFQELKQFIRRKLKEYKYREVKTPMMIDCELWKKTGHWDNYCEHMFTTSSEKKEYCIKPMNCPGHIQIFNQSIKSYRDLPLRIAEFGICHRNEPSGSLHGIMRTREFTQDDAHIFCTITQIQQELNYCIKMIYEVYNILGFKKIIVKLSTRPEKRIGKNAIWDKSEHHLFTVLRSNKINFQYQPNDGAFYGPKIEFILLDALNRSWQCGTIQLDFSLPDLLNTHYVDKDNNYQTPVIIHRAILGSIERFVGLITEEYSGFLPTWLAPIQVVLVNITIEQSEYVSKIAEKLKNINIRVKTDLRNETIGFKIRTYILQRIPYILICGNLEMNQGTISIRTFRGKTMENYNINKFIKKLRYEIYNHSFHQLEE